MQRLTGMMCGNTAGAVGHKYLPSYSELNDYSTVHISNLQLESCDTHLSHVTSHLNHVTSHSPVTHRMWSWKCFDLEAVGWRM